MFLEGDDSILNQKKDQPKKTPLLFDITLNLYRSIIEWVTMDSKRELRIRLSDIDNIKVYDNSIIKLETYNKIDLNLIPKKSEDIKAIVDKIVNNCKLFLGYDIYIENLSNKEFSKNYLPPKTQLFNFIQVYRLLYNSYKRAIRLTADYEYLYEIYENSDGKISKINKIPINQILYIIMYETDVDFFEIVVKSNARFLYQTKIERNIIITHLVDLISNKNESPDLNFLLLSSKPTFGMRVIGFVNEEVDWEFERQLFINLLNCFSDKKLREKIVEDICINFCFKSEKFKQEPVSNKKLYQLLYDLVIEETSNLENFIRSDNDGSNNNICKYSTNQNNHSHSDKLTNKLFSINLYLILCKTLITKSNSDKLISNILVQVEGNPAFQKYHTIFYNSISIFNILIPTNSGNVNLLKKDELAQRKWMLSTHFDNSIKIKNMIYSKIFENKNKKIANFEEQNILEIYILMELEKKIYEFSKEINIMSEIIKELSQFDFLYILYILMRCNSNIMKQISIEILIILIKNLSIEQEYMLKNLILSRTLLPIVLLNIYLKSPNETLNILALKFLKSFLISHVEATNLILNLFPTTLFYHIDKKPNPINWLDHEWDNFFKAVLNDHNSTKIIWSQQNRDELYNFCDQKIGEYEEFTEDNKLITAFNLETDLEKEKELKSYSQYKIIKKDDGVSNYISLTDKTANCDTNTNINHNKIPINCSFYCLNYKEIKMEYLTLKKHVFIWQYYLKKIINENGRPNLFSNIEKPKKFWNKLMDEIKNTVDRNKIILIIKTLTLLYKLYYEIIGVFKEYEYFINLFNSTKEEDVKIIIIQMFMVTVELREKEIKEPNLNKIIDLKAPEFFIKFISDLITNEYIYESAKNKFSKTNIDKMISNTNESNTFLDNRELILKSLSLDNTNFDKNFANYSNYVQIDESYFQADKKIKTCTLIVRFIKILMKKFSIVSEGLQKINFPVPKIKQVFCDHSNFKKILLLLFIDTKI